MRSPVVKFNAALDAAAELDRGPGEDVAGAGDDRRHRDLDEAQRAFEAARRGEPAVGFGEIYIQTGYDPSPAPEGKHLMSVFGQYAPYELAEGDWDSPPRRGRRASSST